MIHGHVLPTFGHRQLGSIRPAEVRAWVGGLMAKGYQPATVRKAFTLLSSALEAAVEDGYLGRSPARGVKLPRIEGHEMRFLSADEIAQLAESIDDRYSALVQTAAYTGLRSGELAALRIDNLNALKRSLRVTETLSDVRGHLSFTPVKTENSRRTVSLPSFLVDELARHLATYPSESSLIFTSSEGEPIRWSNLRRRVWEPAVHASVGEPCRLHDLRHTHAALLIQQGTHPKVIQQRLGHASIKTTLDTYGHLFNGLDEAAAEGLDQAFREGNVVKMWSVGEHGRGSRTLNT